MIEPTVKAQTLPDDLKKHWEDAMATKFPMTKEEAMAYIQNRYRGVSVMMSGQDSIQVQWQQEEPVTEGAAVPPGWSVQYTDAPYTNYATSTTGLYSDEQMMRMMNTRRVPSYMYRYEQVIIDDFRKTAIDEKLKDFKP